MNSFSKNIREDRQVVAEIQVESNYTEPLFLSGSHVFTEILSVCWDSDLWLGASSSVQPAWSRRPTAGVY